MLAWFVVHLWQFSYCVAVQKLGTQNMEPLSDWVCTKKKKKEKKGSNFQSLWVALFEIKLIAYFFSLTLP